MSQKMRALYGPVGSVFYFFCGSVSWMSHPQLSHEKYPGWLGYMGDDTTQFMWGLVHKPS